MKAPRTIVICDQPSGWLSAIPGARLASPRDYLFGDPDLQRAPKLRVFNLSGDYSYQSLGYYVSLLAEARGHRPMPSAETLRDFGRGGALVRVPPQELDEIIQRSLKSIASDQFTLSVYFGRNLAERHSRLVRRLFTLLPAPLLRAEFVRLQDGRWALESIRPIAAKDVPEEHRDFVIDSARRHFAHPSARAGRKHMRYCLAVLTDPSDATPPSDAGALRRLGAAAAKRDVEIEMVTREDLNRIAEFDALFIRATTAVNHFTYRFAKRAAAEGIPVIDDPLSILRCTNKVYLAELFARHGIPQPNTAIVHRGNAAQIPGELGLPLILKQPDSSFSLGVCKAADPGEYTRLVNDLLRGSDLLIAQEFMPTDFDWRIGVLDGKPLFACRYFMARGHWQIYNRSERGMTAGDADTLPVEDAPPAIVDTATRAAALIGDGLYGIDLKEVGGKPVVIEINDNPSIDAGCEDAVLKGALYDALIDSFIRRIEKKASP
ncbi:MAG: RimK family protein [Verrucomicrobiales bacterium]